MATFIAIIIALLWVAFGGWIIQLNVNDIAAYYLAGESAPFWPFFWILLILATTIGGSRAVN